METRPLSKLKRWRIVRIVRPGAQQALAGEGEAAAKAAGRRSPSLTPTGRGTTDVRVDPTERPAPDPSRPQRGVP